MMPFAVKSIEHRATLGVVALAVAIALIAMQPSSAEAGFRVVPGTTERSGPGKLFRYAVKVERSLRLDRRGFAHALQEILFAERGWGARRDVAFKQIRRRHDTEILLAKARTVDRLCAPLQTNGRYSCTQGERIVLNVRRWRQAVDHWHASRANYRRMLVGHEMGHRLGLGHRNCRGGGSRAPIMQQQSIGLQGCRPGWWPLAGELRAVRRIHR